MSTMAHEGTGHAHPGDRNYMLIALFLAAVTAIEVGLYYVDIGKAMIPSLIVLMIIKFGVVAGWFMHLRFDSRMFRLLFLAGIVLAVAVYLAFLSSQQYFGDDTVRSLTKQISVPVSSGQ